MPCDSVTRPAVQTNLFCHEKVSIMLMNLGDVYATCKRFESLCKEKNWQKTSIKSSLSSKIESNTPSSSFSCKWIFTWKDKVSNSLSNMLWKNNTVLWNDGSSPRGFSEYNFLLQNFKKKVIPDHLHGFKEKTFTFLWHKRHILMQCK